MTTPMGYAQDILQSKLTDHALTVALLILAFVLIYIALFADSKLLKAGVLAWTLLP